MTLYPVCVILFFVVLSVSVSPKVTVYGKVADGAGVPLTVSTPPLLVALNPSAGSPEPETAMLRFPLPPVPVIAPPLPLL